jgi:hypothetical protein
MKNTDDSNTSSPENKKVADDEIQDFNMLEFVVPASKNLILKRVITQVPVKKPNKQKFFRVMEEEGYEITIHVLELKDEGDYYLVKPDVLPYLLGEVKYVRLNLAYYQDGTVFLIPTVLPDVDNPTKWNAWHRSLDLAVKRAKEVWVRAISDRVTSSYTLMEAQGSISEPKLPDLSMNEYMKIAFKDKILSGIDHPVVKNLLGVK